VSAATHTSEFELRAALSYVAVNLLRGSPEKRNDITGKLTGAVEELVALRSERDDRERRSLAGAEVSERADRDCAKLLRETATKHGALKFYRDEVFKVLNSLDAAWTALDAARTEIAKLKGASAP
jgi:hypothetical protein